MAIMTSDSIAKKTRDIYLHQHNQYLKDDVLFARFLAMVSDPTYFHLTSEDFLNKRVLDAGCGNTAYFQIVMHQMGVKHMTCLDLGKAWIKPLKTALQSRGIPNDFITYKSGSTDQLPFANETFDITFSNVVLIHLTIL